MKVLVFLAIIAVLIAVAFADRPIKDVNRDLQFNDSKDEVKISGKSKASDRNDEFSFTFNAKNGADSGLRVEYERNDGGKKSEFKWGMKFFRLIEYIEMSPSQNGFDKDDKIASSLRLNQWSDITRTSSFDAASNTTIFKMVSNTKDGVFKITVYIAGSKFSRGGINVTPNSMKFEIEINNYNFQSTNSSLALHARLNSKYEFKNKTFSSKSDTELPLDGSPADGNTKLRGLFKWEPTIQADSTTVDVITSRLFADPEDNDRPQGEGAQMIIFSFPTAKKVTKYVWDPTVGVDDTSAASATSISAFVAVVLSLLVIFL